MPEYPNRPLTNGDLEDRILRLEEIVARCNADRQWIRDRERSQ
jgi:hypothetical protein